MRKTSPPPAVDSSDDPCMTLTEVCAYLRLHRHTVRRLRQAGRFPSPKMLGESMRWHRSQINSWRNDQPDGVGA